MLTRRPYYSTDLSDDDEWEILRPLVPEALRARWSTASSSNSGDTQHHLLRGEGRVRLEATSPRFLAVAEGLPLLLQSLAHGDGTWERIHSTLRERTPLHEGPRVSPSAAIT